MKTEINPSETSRAKAFEYWMKSPMPMVTVVKTFDVTNLCRVSKRKGMKFNMLLSWCIGKAASKVDEFYSLPEGGKLFRYDRLAINVIVNNARGGINSCDIPYSDDLEQFNAAYMARTHAAAESCESSFEDGAMVVGTSAVTATELDCIVNQYTDKFTNPMLLWGRYRKKLFKTTLPISFQFHHVQMDGGQAANFLVELQCAMKRVRG